MRFVDERRLFIETISPDSSERRQALAAKRRACLVLGTACLLLMGLVYSFSMFTLPMINDFHLPSVGFAFYVMMIFFCVGNLVGSVSLGKFGTRITVTFVAVFFATGFCLTGLLCEQFGIAILYMCYSVLGGLGAGIGYNAAIAVVNLWFPDKVGFSSGTMLLGFGFASLVFGNIALALRSVFGSIGPVFVCIGIVGFIVAIAFSRVLEFPPDDITLIFVPKQAALDASAPIDPSVKFEDDNMLKSPIFYVYFAVAMLIGVMGLGVIGSIAADGMSLGIPEVIATTLVALITMINGFARIGFGTFLDRFDMPKTFLVCIGLGLLGMALIVFGFMTSNNVFYTVGAFSVGISYGAGPVLGSTFVRKRFGAKKYPTNLAISTSNLIFGALANMGITMLAGSSRQLFFVCILVCMVLALVGTVLFIRMWNRDMARD